jgi:hypothetical protein
LVARRSLLGRSLRTDCSGFWSGRRVGRSCREPCRRARKHPASSPRANTGTAATPWPRASTTRPRRLGRGQEALGGRYALRAHVERGPHARVTGGPRAGRSFPAPGAARAPLRPGADRAARVRVALAGRLTSPSAIGFCVDSFTSTFVTVASVNSRSSRCCSASGTFTGRWWSGVPSAVSTRAVYDPGSRTSRA